MTKTSIIQLNEGPTPKTEPDLIRIFLTECKVDLQVGIYDHEQGKTQPVIIQVELEAGISDVFRDLKENTIDRVINYAPIYDYIQKDLPQLGQIPLIETVADLIIDFCFKDPRVQKAKVRVDKPDIFPNSVAGIEICRKRSS
ncbi:MAG: dihydroneopterin aldolase [Alphaproteobacteria bacterium]